MKPGADKIKKLFALALDEAAHDGESDNAAVAAIRAMRRGKIGLSDLVDARERLVERMYEPWWSAVVVRFGKHRGKRLGWIAENDPGYVEWMSKNMQFRDQQLERAVRAACKAIDIDEEDYD